MPKMPNPFDKPKGKKAYAFKPYMPKRKAGVDTRPTEREPKRVAPRQRMPKELESMQLYRLMLNDMPSKRGNGRPMPKPMPPKRGIRPMPKPMPKKPKRKP